MAPDVLARLRRAAAEADDDAAAAPAETTGGAADDGVTQGVTEEPGILDKAGADIMKKLNDLPSKSTTFT